MGHFSKLFIQWQDSMLISSRASDSKTVKSQASCTNFDNNVYFVMKKSYKNLILIFVILVVREKFPGHRSRTITVQHGNASPHNIADKDKVMISCNEAPAVQIVSQLARSVDLNVLDLEFSSSIQSLQDQTSAT